MAKKYQNTTREEETHKSQLRGDLLGQTTRALTMGGLMDHFLCYY